MKGETPSIRTLSGSSLHSRWVESSSVQGSGAVETESARDHANLEVSCLFDSGMPQEERDYTASASASTIILIRLPQRKDSIAKRDIASFVSCSTLGRAWDACGISMPTFMYFILWGRA